MNTYNVITSTGEFHAVKADKTSMGDPMLPFSTIVFYIGEEAVAMFLNISSCIKQSA